MAPGERSRLLHTLVDAIEARQEEIAEAEMRNSGCTWRKAYSMDMPVGLIHFRHFAKLADFEPLEPVPQITFPAMSYNYVKARTHRRLRPDHPVELPLPHGHLEDRARRWLPATRWFSSRPATRR